MSFPVKALIAEAEVNEAIKRTKQKLTFDLIECGRNGIKIIPAIGNTEAKKSNKESVIDI